MKQAKEIGESSDSRILTTTTPTKRNDKSITHKSTTPMGDKGTPGRANGFGVTNHFNNQVKSPSDTTIYVPALKRATNGKSPLMDPVNLQRVGDDMLPNSTLGISPQPNVKTPEGTNNDILDKISHLVESIPVEQREEEQSNRTRSVVQIPGQEEAKKRAERAILEAEKFKSSNCRASR